MAAACGDNLSHDIPYYQWHRGGAVGAMEIDHLTPEDVGMLDQVDSGDDGAWVAMFYAHVPNQDIDLATIDALLSRAQDDGLATLTYGDLMSGTPRAGISLSFDDTEVDQWMLLRPVLAKYNAHVSFFVTRYFEFTDMQRAELHQLYEDGNTIEAHGVNHEYAVQYVKDHGLQDLIDNEVVPSITVLQDDGFSPVAYAHPGGSHDREIDEAILEHIPIVRSISGAPKPCKHHSPI
jgi:peptidoglycan/xylan/chitin deacetylase (PgdA/CDA1 family)